MIFDQVDPVDPVQVPVPAQDNDPSTPSPEEDVHITQLQRKIDETQVIRPKELGKNLSLPPVKHNKSKLKKPVENLKKQPVKRNNNNETEYSPHQKYSLLKHEILPKNLRTRKVPGFSPQLNVIEEVSDLSHNSHLPSSEIPSDPVNEPYYVDRNTIAKLEQDLNKVKLVLKRDPNTKNWVFYDNNVQGPY